MIKTTKQALKKAQEVFGKNACVENDKRCPIGGYPHTNKKTGAVTYPFKGRYKIGKIELGMFFAVRGSGDTWDEAFADYHLSAAKDRAEYCRRKAHHKETHVCGMCHYQGPAGRERWAKIVGEALVVSAA